MSNTVKRISFRMGLFEWLFVVLLFMKLFTHMRLNWLEVFIPLLLPLLFIFACKFAAFIIEKSN